MIQLSAAGKRYGHKLLFEGAYWMITPRDRVGLVGANGTGKSTVMKILPGLETLDYGPPPPPKSTTPAHPPPNGPPFFGEHAFSPAHRGFSPVPGPQQQMRG